VSNWCSGELPYNRYTMSAVPPLSPIDSEFTSVEAAEQYDRWYRAKVQASIADPRSQVPHDEVMSELRERIEAKRRSHAADPMAR
jgi:hypothetical protein